MTDERDDDRPLVCGGCETALTAAVVVGCVLLGAAVVAASMFWDWFGG